MATIPLHDGTEAIVDDSDVELLSRYHWTNSRYPMTTMECDTPYGMPYKKPVAMHMLLAGCPLDGMDVDHINLNKLDNRRCNLRICSRSQNLANRLKQKGTSSQYKGVSRYRNKWQSYIRTPDGMKHLGYFDSEGDAAKAYDLAAKDRYGPFSRINFPCAEDNFDIQ